MTIIVIFFVFTGVSFNLIVIVIFFFIDIVTIIIITIIKNCRSEVSVKKVFLKISQNSRENNCNLQLYLKGDSGTGVFL